MSQANFQKAEQLSIYSGNCLRSRSPLSTCASCETLCPEQALLFQDDKWQAQNCSLCGLCAMVCPGQVFQIDQHRVMQHQKGQPLFLCCSQNTQAPAEAIRVNCLQQFSPLSLIYLLYHHPQLTLYIVPSECQSCRHSWYAQGLLQQLEQYRIPSDKLRIIMQEAGEPAAADGNQRRELFRDLFRRTERHSRKAAMQTVDKLTAAFSSAEVPVEQTEIFPTRLPLYAMYVKKQLPVQSEAELPFRQLVCSACTFCSACTHVCPTQALTLLTLENEKSLQFQPELCINCGLCQSVCMQRGLEWDDFLTQGQFLETPKTIARSAEKICSACEHEFYQWPDTEDSICSFCRR